MDALRAELHLLLERTKEVHEDVEKSRFTTFDRLKDTRDKLTQTINQLSTDIEHAHQQSVAALTEFMQSTSQLVKHLEESCDHPEELMKLQQKASLLEFPVVKTLSFIPHEVDNIGRIVTDVHPSENINSKIEHITNMVDQRVAERHRKQTEAIAIPDIKPAEDEMIRSARNVWMSSMSRGGHAPDTAHTVARNNTHPLETGIAFKSKQLTLRFPKRKLPTRLPHRVMSTACSTALPTPLQSTQPTPHISPTLTPPPHSPMRTPLNAPLINIKTEPFVPMNKEPLSMSNDSAGSEMQSSNRKPDWPDDDKENSQPISIENIADLQIQDLPAGSSPKCTPNRPSVSALSKLLQNPDSKNFNVSLKTVLKGEHYGFQFPIGVEVYKDGLIVCNSGSGSVMYIQMDGEHNVVEKIYLQGTYKRPSAATVLDGFLFVKDDVTIKKYDNNLRLITEFRKNLGRPYGLSVYKSMLITMTNCGNGRTAPYQPSLLLYDVDGNFVEQIYLDIPTTFKTKLRFMDVFSDQIYISDLGASHVFCVDVQSGKLNSVVGKPGTHLGEFNEPSGITCDSNGNILIADSRADRILVYESTGVCRGILTCEGRLHRPSGILVSDNDTLFTVSYLGGFNITIYDLRRATAE